MLEAACLGAIHYMVEINFKGNVEASIRPRHFKSTVSISSKLL